MSVRVASPPIATAIALDKAAAPAKAAKAKEDVKKVGRDFEAILVRQMLTSCKVAGKSGGYADMAVEALASAVTAGGGLGLGRAIEASLTPHDHRIVEKDAPAKESVLRSGAKHPTDRTK
jgi:Rod binding domain-containing protein